MTEPPLRFRGRVAKGKGEATAFTAASWAREGFQRLVGIDPFPGTLNLMMDAPQSRAVWAALRARPGIRMTAPDPAWCAARLYPVMLSGGVEGAIVLPEVPGYPEDQVEIIAGVSLRHALGLAEGDSVEVTVAEAPLR